MSKKTVLEMVEFHQPQPVCNRMQARIRLRDNVGLRRGRGSVFCEWDEGPGRVARMPLAAVAMWIEREVEDDDPET